MKKFALGFVTVALIATSAFAQMGPGMGGGGPGGKGRYAWGQGTTPGWTLMTTQEQSEWQTKMRSVKTLGECNTLRDEHRALMETRAKEKGVQLPAPRQNGCDVMQARGFIK